jgi:hypothetical protein
VPKGAQLWACWARLVKTNLLLSSLQRSSRGEKSCAQIPDGKDMRVTSFVIYQKDKTLSDNAQQFLDLLKRWSETSFNTRNKAQDKTSEIFRELSVERISEI